MADHKHIKRVVLLKFKPGTSQDTLNAFEADLAKMEQAVCGSCQGIDWGVNLCQEKAEEGTAYGVIFKFDNEANARAFVDNPKSVAFRAKYHDQLDRHAVVTFQGHH